MKSQTSTNKVIAESYEKSFSKNICNSRLFVKELLLKPLQPIQNYDCFHGLWFQGGMGEWESLIKGVQHLPFETISQGVEDVKFPKQWKRRQNISQERDLTSIVKSECSSALLRIDHVAATGKCLLMCLFYFLEISTSLCNMESWTLPKEVTGFDTVVKQRSHAMTNEFSTY